MNNPFQSYNRGYTARERRIRRDLGMLLAITCIISVWLAFRTTSQDRTINELEVTNTALSNKADSLYEESSEAHITMQMNSRYEEVITTLYVDDMSSHKMMNDDKGFVSKFSKSQRANIVNRIKELEKQNQYPFCSWIIAIEIFRKENRIAAEEIDEFVGHLTE